ncbi:MAG: hypothetical protein OEV87_12355 [Phycisphaerae bacterium]|nr:hypothetical protein [Phycisphaerae bacterium]
MENGELPAAMVREGCRERQLDSYQLSVNSYQLSVNSYQRGARIQGSEVWLRRDKPSMPAAGDLIPVLALLA